MYSLYTARMDARHYNHTKLVKLREKRELSQETVATNFGWERKKVLRAETGESATYETLLDLAAFYEIPIKQLLYAEPVGNAA